MESRHHVTKEDLRDLRDSLVDRLDDGFKGVYKRQDHTNGRLLEAEKDIREHATLFKEIHRALFGGGDGGRRQSDPVARPSASAITQRDVKVVAATLGAISGTVLFFWQAVPFIVWLAKVLTP